jgi:uncharacterized RDD family membrane protein YckC
MSDTTKRRSVADQPMYIGWALLLIAIIWILQVAIPVGLYCAFYGVPTISEWVAVQLPDYTRATLWKGRVWYPVTKTGPGNPPGKGFLFSFDPLTGGVSESKVQIPLPTLGLIADGDRRWAISPNMVVRIDDDQTTEFKPGRLLNQASEPFLYNQQVAVIDLSTKGVPTLLVLQNNEWIELGTVEIPYDFQTHTVDGKVTLVPPVAPSVTRNPMLDLKVIAREDRIHLFVCDGSVIVYRDGLTLAPATELPADNAANADAAANSQESTTGGLQGWEVVSAASSRIYIGGKDLFKVGLVAGEPVMLTVYPATPNTAQILAMALQVYRRVDGVWKKTAETPTPGSNEILTVSDGETTYVASISLARRLRFQEVTNDGLKPTGTILKAPVTPFQQPLERFIRLSQWVYWPGILLLAAGLGQLMTLYLDPDYQFGLTHVELASITRRGIARAIDYFLYVIPSYLLALVNGLASEDQVAESFDKMIDTGPGGTIFRIVWAVFGTFLLWLTILVVTSVFQGLWGVTPGKWLCGIRTVRSTLRPCGVLAAMLREILLPAETLLTMTWLPATVMISFTSCRQRLGDMAADTIVIRKRKVVSATAHAADPQP